MWKEGTGSLSGSLKKSGGVVMVMKADPPSGRRGRTTSRGPGRNGKDPAPVQKKQEPCVDRSTRSLSLKTMSGLYAVALFWSISISAECHLGRDWENIDNTVNILYNFPCVSLQNSFVWLPDNHTQPPGVSGSWGWHAQVFTVERNWTVPSCWFSLPPFKHMVFCSHRETLPL